MKAQMAVSCTCAYSLSDVIHIFRVKEMVLLMSFWREHLFRDHHSCSKNVTLLMDYNTNVFISAISNFPDRQRLNEDVYTTCIQSFVF